MARVLNSASLEILGLIQKKGEAPSKEIYKDLSASSDYKSFYNNIYRLLQLELIEKKISGQNILLTLTTEGFTVLKRRSPEKDGIWKLVIFDIPEKHKYVRTILRAKLKTLYFKKWQNSIWISPYALDAEIEQELKEIGEKFFVRLIKTTSINVTKDLEKLFPNA